MTQSLKRLNELAVKQAEAEFLKCCGSIEWANAMAGRRPFETFGDLVAQADRIWWSLTESDWLEAFRAHPKIGESKTSVAQSSQAQSWSAQEQSQISSAPADVVSELAELNRRYEARFGFIFIVCATGKTSEEMLALLKARVQNDRGTELSIAAEEQRKITLLRLEKLLGQ